MRAFRHTVQMIRATALAVPMAVGIVALSAPQRSLQRPGGGTITTSAVDAVTTRLMDAAHVTGAGVAIFHGGRVAYLKAYGARDLGQHLPLTPDSVMSAASLTKAVFATVVMRLVQDGVISLDSPISQYLPKPLPEYTKYRDLKGDERYKKLTLRILLSHTSGFPNWRAFEDDRTLRIHFEPGTRYAYSGEGIDLAQLVVETAARRPVADLMNELLFRPLDMSRTRMTWQSTFENDAANGYDEYERMLGPNKHLVSDAAGSMHTTLRDYATFLSAVMRDQVLSARTTKTMLSPVIRITSAHQFPSLAPETTAANDRIQLAYGLGWGLYSSPYGKAFFKEGHDEGWRHLALCFEDGAGILIMTNSSNGEGIFKPLIDSIMGPTGFPFEWEGYTPYDKLPALPPLKTRKTISLGPDQVGGLIGRYAVGQDVVIAVTYEDGHLYVQENSEPRQELLAESPTDFHSAVSSDEWTFRVEPGGRAQSLVLHLGNKDLELKRIQ
jgi:CubicO group peptidase (beta-lactamase class C family)